MKLAEQINHTNHDNSEMISEIYFDLFDIMVTNNHRMWRMMSLPLPLSHFIVLFFLRNNGMTIISEIAHSLSISKQQMSPIIDRLVKNGLIEKKCLAKDKRFVQVNLTRKGKLFLENHRKEQKEKLKEHMQHLEDIDTQAFAESAGIIKKSIETMFK